MVFWIKTSHYGKPVFFTLVTLLVLLLFWNVFYQSPSILAVEPRQARPGEVVVISGLALGTDETQGWVGIGGRRIANSYIIEWSNNKISFRVPHNLTTGILSVHTQNGDASGSLVINIDQVPQKERVISLQNGRSIRSILGERAFPGSKVVLQGGGFGASPSDNFYVADFLVSHNEVLSWDSDRIEFFVPIVRTGPIRFAGDSSDLPSGTVSVNPLGAEISYGKPIHYSIEMTYDVADVNLLSGGQGLIQLYFPTPLITSSQSLLSTESHGDFVENSISNVGQKVFHRELSSSDLKLSQSLSFVVQTKSQEYKVDPSSLPQVEGQKLYPQFLESSPLVPFGQGELLKLSKALKADEPNQFIVSQKIISWIRDNIKINDTNTFILAPEVLRDKSGSMIGVSSLHVALFRLAEIPARLVEGYIVKADGKLQQRIWCEYFILGLGWIPLDPKESSDTDPRKITFDNKHIAFLIEEQNGTLTRISESSVKNFQKLQFMEVHAESLGQVESFGFTIHDPVLRLVQNGATER